jgi:hypothetical protein
MDAALQAIAAIDCPSHALGQISEDLQALGRQPTLTVQGAKCRLAMEQDARDGGRGCPVRRACMRVH